MYRIFRPLLACAVLFGLLGLESLFGNTTANFQEADAGLPEDAWPGIPDGGWSTAWTTGRNGNCLITTEILEENPLEEGGAYLRVQVANEDSGSTKAGAVRRAYAEENGIRYDQPHQVSFLFRFEGDLADINRIAIFDAPEPALAPHLTQGAATWQLRSQDQNWVVWDGAKIVDTELPVVAENVYRVTLSLTPSPENNKSTYRIKLEDLTEMIAYESGPLGFFSDRNTVGGYLTFSLVNEPEKTAAFSLDQIEISPSQK